MKTFKVEYTKRTGGVGQILVRANNEHNAMTQAPYLCHTGTDFRNAVQIADNLYVRPRLQGFQGSERKYD